MTSLPFRIGPTARTGVLYATRSANLSPASTNWRGRLGWYAFGKLVDKLQQHFQENKQFLGICLGHHRYLVIGFVSLLPNVVNPDSSMRWDEPIGGKKFDVLHKGPAWLCTLVNGNIHEQFSCSKYGCRVGASCSTHSSLAVKSIDVRRNVVDAGPKWNARLLSSALKVGGAVAVRTDVYGRARWVLKKVPTLCRDDHRITMTAAVSLRWNVVDALP